MTASTRNLLLLAGALASQAAIAYETPVHSLMTHSAFTKSVRDRDFLLDLGTVHYFDAAGNLATEGFLGKAALGWAMQGSIDEDDFGRNVRHFFDPLSTGRAGLGGTFTSALEWVFDETGNDFSLPATRNYLYAALTTTDAIARPKKWRDTFLGVGQFTHMLQDMAQPQHVRDDGHFSLTENFYGLFPDYSVYEKRTDATRNTLRYTGYTSVDLPTYRRYWTGGFNGQGLAESTNRNFVSEGRNLDDTKYISPVSTLAIEETLPVIYDVRLFLIATNVTFKFASYTHTDPIEGSTVVNNRLSTFSAFDNLLMRMTGRHTYSLNVYNHDRAAEILVPRAVGYSAGLINRFFRGSLEITPPNDKIYGIVDHSTIHQTDPVSGFVGFEKIKLKVRDAAAGSEALSGGKLVAVAKFHRNGCYKDDLSGEFAPGVTPACPATYRTRTEEIVVSEPFVNVSLDKGTPAEYVFTFPQQIPINATDLFIQVVYRGKMGDEADEVAVGTKDLFEPNYLSIFNVTDHILFNGAYVKTTSPSLLPTLDMNGDGALDAQFQPTNLQLTFGFTDGLGGIPIATVVDLPPARYSRVALLTDRTPYASPIRSTGAFGFQTGTVFQFNAEKNQLNQQTGAYNVSTLGKVRGVTVWNSLLISRAYPTTGGGDAAQLSVQTDLEPFPLTTLSFP